jgi:hypothetical protein
VNVAARVAVSLSLLTLPAGLWLGGSPWKWLATAATLFLVAVIADSGPPRSARPERGDCRL